MKVVIACGGTGGHIFPAIGLAESLEKNNVQILFIGTKRDIEEQIKKRGYKLETLDITTISFESIIRSISSAIKLIKSLYESFKILGRIRPDVVIGFGGYVSGPVLLAAYIRRIPTIIHEQNVIIGRANYILAKFVNRIAVSFKESEKYFKSNKVSLTGCPIRSEILDVNRKEALELFNFDNDKFTILVMGGSQGSSKINQVFLEAVSLFEEKNRLQIIHICGQRDYEFVSLEYKKMDIKAKAFAFFEKIGYAYNIADLVICRAGAATISELISLGLTSILIPYPFVRIHQRQNAEILSGKAAAILIEDKYLTATGLKEKMIDLIKDEERLLLMRSRVKELYIADAADNLTKEIFSLSREKQ